MTIAEFDKLVRDLKPCGYCGAFPVMEWSPRSSWYIVCPKCKQKYVFPCTSFEKADADDMVARACVLWNSFQRRAAEALVVVDENFLREHAKEMYILLRKMDAQLCPEKVCDGEVWQTDVRAFLRKLENRFK